MYERNGKQYQFSVGLLFLNAALFLHRQTGTVHSPYICKVSVVIPCCFSAELSSRFWNIKAIHSNTLNINHRFTAQTWELTHPVLFRIPMLFYRRQVHLNEPESVFLPYWHSIKCLQAMWRARSDKELRPNAATQQPCFQQKKAGLPI